ncbi:MAG TPA: hypothetical protein PKN13_12345, partial [Accumulibacter sp.]|nr:hypothetical protein [Accumulibacter sp.]HND79692.1 hypothetical protein [Accumulibacter sp.]HNL13878.1 hypothetical protein [Accumulibacter sp.]HNL76569.1 hypothetical protein [Accumulibacter sp.]HNM76113.1 hypothetical protein [Accumulibacter sp.]
RPESQPSYASLNLICLISVSNAVRLSSLLLWSNINRTDYVFPTTDADDLPESGGMVYIAPK